MMMHEAGTHGKQLGAAVANQNQNQNQNPELVTHSINHHNQRLTTKGSSGRNLRKDMHDASRVAAEIRDRDAAGTKRTTETAAADTAPAVDPIYAVLDSNESLLMRRGGSVPASIRFLEKKQHQKQQQQQEEEEDRMRSGEKALLPWKRGGQRWSPATAGAISAVAAPARPSSHSSPRSPSSSAAAAAAAQLASSTGSKTVPIAFGLLQPGGSPKPLVGACSGFGAAWTSAPMARLV
jgi:hypothetical protein